MTKPSLIWSCPANIILQQWGLILLNHHFHKDFQKIFKKKLDLAKDSSQVTFITFFFLILTRGHFSIFCSDRVEGREGKREREREKERNIDAKGTHRVATTCTTNQGRGQTATEVRALSGNRTRVSPDRRPVL
uniref:Uncharacterized protein n=1 Tax=Molossus molossus TaxID=27622 RepID=A0A7J8FTR4_MOLMO|nr:hypothetical protein HJG59_008400 [Molossus molossus]